MSAWKLTFRAPGPGWPWGFFNAFPPSAVLSAPAISGRTSNRPWRNSGAAGDLFVKITFDRMADMVPMWRHALAMHDGAKKLASHLFRCDSEPDCVCKSTSNPGNLNRLPGLFGAIPSCVTLHERLDFLEGSPLCSFCTFPAPLGPEGCSTNKGARVSGCCSAFAAAPISAKTPTATLLTVIRFTGPDACPDTDDLLACQELQDDRTPSHFSQSHQSAPPIRFLFDPSCYNRGTLTPRITMPTCL